MGLLTKDIKTLNDAFVHVLETTYYAEKQITAALPKMIEKVTAPELKQGLDIAARNRNVADAQSRFISDAH